MKPFKAIAAMSENGVIGYKNQIPWRLPEDFKWFKKLTVNNTIVMGRKTFDSIGKPLPNRKTIVLSRNNPIIEGVDVITHLNQIMPQSIIGEVFICGGGIIYELALPYCSDLYLTLVKRTVPGDAFFPPFNDRFELIEIIENNNDFEIQHYYQATPDSLEPTDAN